MNRESLRPPVEFRFTEPRDAERYGSDWYVYDELKLVTQPARVLVPLELEIGAPLAMAMDGFRDDSVFGESVAAWLALYFAGKYVPWADFQPAIMLAEWRLVDPGKAPAEDSAPISTGTTPTDTVSLPTLPEGESQP
jgi:hypothetical protein